MSTFKATRILVLSALLGGAVGLPAGSAHAQRPTPAPASDAEETLTAQERKMLGLARAFARRCTEAIESWLEKGEVSEARLFASLYYPIAGTAPPKFETDWDDLADRDIRPISDEVLGQSASIAFAVMVDRHGYLPAHNQKYSLPLTGNPAADLVGNRTKRIFADRTGYEAAKSEAPFLLLEYKRDTGERMKDLSVPVLIRGKKWGSVRIGFQPVQGD